MKNALTDKDPMPFGKHKGQKMINVPASYLLWLWDDPMFKTGDVHEYIKDNLDVLQAQAKKSTR